MLINDEYRVVGSGTCNWESKLEDGYWSYSEEDVWNAIKESLEMLFENNSNLEEISVHTMGVSAMMHGYLAFDKENRLLVPFRTWRNRTTEESAHKLSELFNFNIPQRWSIAHLYQAILNNEEHVNDIAYITTLAGYVHWKLTGEKVLGIGDASGVFPVDDVTKDYDTEMILKFNQLLSQHQIKWKIEEILPEIKLAGQQAGTLTSNGLEKLSFSNSFSDTTMFCPPEGDAGTGMVATNCVIPRTANVSVGTSAFIMIVLENKLKDYYKEVDIVSTPIGENTAMIHTNNCSLEINAWVNMFQELLKLFGYEGKDSDVYQKLFEQIKSADNDSEILLHSLHSGENVFDLSEGNPVLIRQSKDNFSIANVMKSNLYSAFVPLKRGLEILAENETIEIDKLIAHGGLFNTPKVAQKILASALQQPISIVENAGEGGAWGIALLAQYLNYNDQFELNEFLNERVFKEVELITTEANEEDILSYNNYYNKFVNSLPIQTKVQNLFS